VEMLTELVENLLGGAGLLLSNLSSNPMSRDNEEAGRQFAATAGVPRSIRETESRW
jgi:hypothetical protein